jgi:hypothetical protein
MNTIDLINAISQAIATDKSISAWCITTYGRQHQVLVSYDGRNPPGSDQCPYVALWPDTKGVGRSRIEKPHAVMFDICVHDESSRTPTGMDNLTEYNGVARVEALRKLVETAVAGINLTPITTNRVLPMATVDIEYDNPESFPFFPVGMMVEFVETMAIGGDHLA